MYIPSHFKISDFDEIEAIIGRYDFATILTNGEDGPLATHVPVVLRKDIDTIFLEGHVSIANEHWRALDHQNNVLIIFQGPHAYVSPRYYVNPTNVPTWNYVAVHAYGNSELVYGDDLIGILERLTAKQESGRPNPWSLSELDSGYVDKLSKGIVGFRIAVQRFEAKAKMSQNKPLLDIESAIVNLRDETGSSGRNTADWMEKLKPDKTEA